VDDLGKPAESSFEAISGEEIIKSFMKDRYERTENTRQVAPLTHGREVWVLARGNDHRAGTWYDPAERVVWLLAYGRHRSGDPTDFFPYCKRLDAEARLLPTDADYERLIRDRDTRFAAAIRIEGPLLLKKARASGKEERVVLGGEYGACVAIETANGMEETTLAFRVETLPFDHLPIILKAVHAGGEWEDASEMPSRPLDQGEIAFRHLHER
jgi:hypothetical protein